MITPQETHTTDRYPRPRFVVSGFLDGDDHTCVWCHWCCDWHHHGADPVGSMYHKWAHCYAPGGPYEEDGYWIRVHSTPASTVKAVMRCATGSQKPALYEGRTTPVLKRLRAQSIPQQFLDE